MLHDEAALGFLLENFTVGPGSALDGRTLGQMRIREKTGASIVGLKRGETGIIPNLQTSTIFEAGDTVIALGSRKQLAQLERLLKPEGKGA